MLASPSLRSYSSDMPDSHSDDENHSDFLSTDFELRMRETVQLGDIDESISTSRYGETVEEDGQVKKQEVTVPLDKAICDAEGSRYEITSVLGEGGGGRVYEARDKQLNRVVALKVINEQSKDVERRVSRFIGEAQITSRLEHPNILPIFDIGHTESGLLYYTMRKAEGQPLSDLLDRMLAGYTPDLIASFPRRIEIIMRVCDAVAYAHAQGFIHQDIKPENIMLGSYGEVMLVDWGTAIAKEDVQSNKGKMMGTPAFMSPEQARRETVDERSDVYCIGASMFQLMSGLIPLRTGDANSFFAKKRKGIIDPLPPEKESQIPEALMRVMMKAMAVEAEDRYQTVEDMQVDLRAYQQNRDSLRLTNVAAETFETCKANPNHQLYVRCTQSLVQALELWPNNEHAQELLLEVRTAHAYYLIENKNFDVARSIFGEAFDDFPDIKSKIIRGEQELRAEHKRAKIAKVASGLALMFIFLLGIYASYEYSLQQTSWILVKDVKFDQRSGLIHIEKKNLSDYEVLPLDPDIDKNGILLEGNEIYFVKDAEYRQDVKVQVEVMWPEKVDGLEILLHVKDVKSAVWWHTPQSYICQAGGYKNTKSFTSVVRNSGTVTPRDFSSISFEVGKIYQVTFEYHQNQLRLSVDGDNIIEQTTLLPIGGADCNRVALRCWSEARIKSLKVWRQRPAEKSIPTIAGDSLAAEGNFAASRDIYLALVDDFPDTYIAEESLAKAIMSAIANNDQQTSIAEYLQILRSTYSQSAYLTRCEEKFALYLWRNAEVSTALELCNRIQEKRPESQLPLDFIDEGNPGLSSVLQFKFLECVARMQEVEQLSLDGFAVSDLSPLANMKLNELTLNRCGIEDISPLKGMQLTKLHLNGNRIRDISALDGMPLKDLLLSSNAIEDISALEGMSLNHLSLENNRVKDISALAGMPLDYLNIAQNPVDDISVLSEVPSLRRIYMSNTPVKDFSSLEKCKLTEFSCFKSPYLDDSIWILLEKMPLEHLSLHGTKITRVGQLSESLRFLELQKTNVSNIDSLVNLPNLYDLNINFTKVKHMPFKPGSSIRILDMEGVPVTDYSFLKRMTFLQQLIVDRNDLRTLKVLEHPILFKLSCKFVKHSYVPTIRCPKLKDLSLRGSKLEDLPHMRAPLMQYLEISGNKIKDLSSLHGKPVRLIFDNNRLSEAEIDVLIDSWQGLLKSSNAIHFLRCQYAWQQKDVVAMKKLATARDGYLYFNTGAYVLFDEAEQLAGKYGAWLPCILNPSTQRWISAEQRPFWLTWLGTAPTTGINDKWDCGEPILFDRRIITLDTNDYPDIYRMFGNPVNLWERYNDDGTGASLFLMWKEE